MTPESKSETGADSGGPDTGGPETGGPVTSGPDAEQVSVAEMARFGITRHPVDYFYYKEFRYTRLEDALAQARRAEPDAPADERIGGHFDKANMGGALRVKPPTLPDQPWCNSKGKNIVEGGYTQ